MGIAAHTLMGVALGQFVYEQTRNPLYLGYIGLCFFLPKLAFTLPAGHTADRYDRKKVVALCRFSQVIGVAGILANVVFFPSQIWLLFLLILILGTAYTFDGPASHAIVPHLVSPEHFSNAITWNSWVFQLAVISGPALGGWIYGVGGNTVHNLIVVLLMRLCSFLFIVTMKTRPSQREKESLGWSSMMAGLKYVYREKIILGTISLDLFAVLLGGAVALLPIYANDILKVGPAGLGWMRSAPAFGAALIALLLAYLPPMKHAGKTMLGCVAVFGMATIVFGISKNIWLSLSMLFIMGAFDMVSVVIRGVVVQVQTPPTMRGRVSAVNLIFIGASNELGEFESGLAASLFGVVPSVILGGLGTLGVVALWSWKFPEIRRYKSLDVVT